MDTLDDLLAHTKRTWVTWDIGMARKLSLEPWDSSYSDLEHHAKLLSLAYSLKLFVF